MAKKKVPQVFLSALQVAHLISSSAKNLIDLKIHEDEEGYRFLLILDCISPEECIPHDQESDSDDEIFNIICAHNIFELNDWFDAIISVKHDDDKFYRGFSTVAIDDNNMAEFVQALSLLDDFWAEIDQSIEDEEELQKKIKGKNFIQGNGTVN